jgi:uncharacterized protein (UPF0548 family)
MTARGPSRSHRWRTAVTWPFGIALSSWDYFWRTTPVHRSEVVGSPAEDGPPALPADVERSDMQGAVLGVGPLFHRRYTVRIRDAKVSAQELIARIQEDLNSVSPTRFARFVKTSGEAGAMRVGDEYLVRMPGPWDGPVRVIAVSSTTFRLATLDGHLEAGQIEFRATASALLQFEIEAWACSGDRLSNVLYSKLRIGKEIQLHMWISFLERVVECSGGRRTGALQVKTRRLEGGPSDLGSRVGSPAIQQALEVLRKSHFNFAAPEAAELNAASGWRLDDLCQALPSESPGPPLPDGSFATAQKLMRGYEFVDPSVVRAYYDEKEPLEGRTMLLVVRFHGLRFHAGVRVRAVHDTTIESEGRPAYVWGWTYGTLTGHFEMGQMDWQVSKWLDTGEVQFRITAYSRPAPVRNPFVRLGFRVFGRREQLAFLRSTMSRMARLTALTVDDPLADRAGAGRARHCP